MQQMTDAFYILSNALLLPVMGLLLVSLIRVLLQTGGTLQEYLLRQQANRSLPHLKEAILNNANQWPDVAAAGELQKAIGELLPARHDLPRIAYVTEQAELVWQNRLDRLRGLVKLGPGLGLMGTLIPLGPALVGLAVGDIQTMSNNLVIAFSTTVVGLFIGLVAGFLVSVRKHWYQSDATLLNFAAERLITHNASSDETLSRPTLEVSNV